MLIAITSKERNSQAEEGETGAEPTLVKEDHKTDKPVASANEVDLRNTQFQMVPAQSLKPPVDIVEKLDTMNQLVSQSIHRRIKNLRKTKGDITAGVQEGGKVQHQHQAGNQH